jgi:peroxiredoxin
MPDRVRVRGRWGILLAYFIVAILSAEVVLLTLQNRKLKTMLSTTTSLGLSAGALQSGEQVKPIKFQTLGGITAELRYDDPRKKYLLFVFSTTCPHCEKNLAVWRAIAEKPRADGLNIIGVSIQNLDQTTKYVTEKNPNFYIVAADTDFGQQYKITGVPETILINGNGSVEQTWLGELSPNQAKEIVDRLSPDRSKIN